MNQQAIRELEAAWAERDRRYAVGPTLTLTDAQVDAIRLNRYHEAEALEAVGLVHEARHWTPPPFAPRGRL